MSDSRFKVLQANSILKECFGDNGVWADPSRYRRQCWTRDFGLAIQPLLLSLGETEIAAKHLRSIEARQEVDGRIPILFLDGPAGHVRFLVEKTKRSLRDGKVSFMLGRYLHGQLGQLTPGTKDSELFYIIAALEFEVATGKLPVSLESVGLAMRYIKRNLLNREGLFESCDWRDTMEKQLGGKALLTNNALLCHAYDLLAKKYRHYEGQAEQMRKLVNDTFWKGSLLQDWPGNTRFDPLGASLAVLYDVIDPSRYDDVARGFRSIDTPNGVTIQCKHNPISDEEKAVIKRTGGVVVWPFVVGFSVLAHMKMWRNAGPDGTNRDRSLRFAQMAEDQFQKLLKLEGFREWYDPATGNGYGADRQLWSATLFTRAWLDLHPR
jgi:glycogen debranching enzyme